MEKKRYAVSSPDVLEREMANMALVREAAREGFVLLKNDGVLPLRSKKIALYGVGARKTLKGGTGNGSVNERRSICTAFFQRHQYRRLCVAACRVAGRKARYPLA